MMCSVVKRFRAIPHPPSRVGNSRSRLINPVSVQGSRPAELLGLSQGQRSVPTRGGLADLSELRKASPLPETADELCTVAREAGADEGDIRLGERATEREVKDLSRRGALAQYR